MARRIKLSTWGTGLRFDKRRGYYVRVQIGVDDEGDPIYTRDYFSGREAREIVKMREALIKDILKATEGGKVITRRVALSIAKRHMKPASYKDIIRKQAKAKTKKPGARKPAIAKAATYEEELILRRVTAHFPKISLNDIYMYLTEEAIKIFWEFYPDIDYGVSWSILEAMGLNPEDYEASVNDDDLGEYW